MKKTHLVLPAEVAGLLKELDLKYSRPEYLYRNDEQGYCILFKEHIVEAHKHRLVARVTFPEERRNGEIEYSLSGDMTLNFTEGEGDNPLRNLLNEFDFPVDNLLRTKRLKALIFDE